MATFQESIAARNARLNALNTEISTGGIVKIFSGALPVNCAAADPTGALCTITLTGSAFAAASAGAMAMTGTWSGTASGTGTAACFRLYDSGGTTCHQQGDVGQVSGSIAAAGSFTTASTTITLASTGAAYNVAGTPVYDGTTGQKIGFVSSISTTTVTLQAVSLINSAGAADSIVFGGAMTLNSTAITSSQTVSVSSYTITAGNA